MALTQEQKDQFLAETGMDSVPNGDLIVEGDRFNQLQEELKEAISEGNLPSDVKLIGLVDRVILEVTPIGMVHRDFLAVLTTGDAEKSLGLLDTKGVNWYTKEQADGIRKLVSLT